MEVEEDRVNVLPQWPEHVVSRWQLAEVFPFQKDGQLYLPLGEDLVDVGRHLSQPVALRGCLFHLVLNVWDADGPQLTTVSLALCCLVRILQTQGFERGSPFECGV